MAPQNRLSMTWAVYMTQKRPCHQHLAKLRRVPHGSQVMRELTHQGPQHWPCSDTICERLEEHRDSQKLCYDCAAEDLPPSLAGQAVRVQDPVNGQWNPAHVVCRSEEWLYYVFKTPNGSMLRCNRRHLQDIQSAEKRVHFFARGHWPRHCHNPAWPNHPCARGETQTQTPHRRHDLVINLYHLPNPICEQISLIYIYIYSVKWYLVMHAC